MSKNALTTIFLAVLASSLTYFIYFVEGEDDLAGFFEVYLNSSIEGVSINIYEHEGQEIGGFCVLSPYESVAIGGSDLAVGVNDFLQEKGFISSENHWVMIFSLKGGGHRMVYFNSSREPLVYPRPSFDGGNCKAGYLVVNKVKFTRVGELDSHFRLNIN